MKSKTVFYCVLFILLVVLVGSLILVYNFVFYPLKYKNEIINFGEKYGVQPFLIASIINCESRFNEKAVSNKGAVGLMQILPTTGKWAFEKIYRESVELSFVYNKEEGTGELLNPLTNIELGTFYLSYLLNKFGNLEVSICAYNAGEGTVLKWLNNKDYSEDGKTLKHIPYSETQNYLNKVLGNIKIYKNKFK